MALSDEVAGTLLLLSIVGLAGLAVVVVLLVARLRSLRRDYAAALDSSRREDVFEAMGRHAQDIARLRDDLAVVHGNTETLRNLIRGTVSRVAVVRYDAFDDMGGALSFSAALLDEHGDGVVISAINGRTETRTYAKAVAAGESAHHLSEEEREAISQARSGTKAERVVTRRGRRRSA